MLCIASVAGVLAIATAEFTLDWTHSTALTRWVETWTIEPGGLRPVTARVQGSGAGMDIPNDAVRTDQGWHYMVHLPPRPLIHLAASGLTPDPWRLCARGTCHDLGALPQAPIRLWSGSCTAMPEGDPS